MALAAALALGVGAPASAATTLSAGWTDACGSGSNCFSNDTFRQSFSASEFSGLVTVGQLLLDRSILGDLDGKTFRLSFSLNGEELGSWGKFTMAGVAGDQLAFGGENFTWNPEDGDLVLILEILAPPKEGGMGGTTFTGMYLATERSEDPAQFPQDNNGPGGEPGGPPNLPQTSPTPEPSAWALMILGFGGAGGLLRRRRGALAAA